MLKAIEIENFKAFGDRTRIERRSDHARLRPKQCREEHHPPSA